MFAPTARLIWDRLIDLPRGLKTCGGDLTGSDAVHAWDAARRGAEAQCATVFDELASAHRLGVQRERRKGTHAFASRRRAIDRLGLSNVRAYRLRLLAEDEAVWSRELAVRESALPDLAAVMMVRIAPLGGAS